MNRRGNVFIQEHLAGMISETDEGFSFAYNRRYLDDPDAAPVSFTLPVQDEPFISKTLFPFFDGLIPEGWLLDIARHTWKLDSRDRMGLLLACCIDCIGAVSVHPVEEAENG